MLASNREEAFRAREIASKKMENKDFIGAQKMILKAQKLFPELDNVAQLLTICKVHCAAEAMVNGVMDWYGILQVELGADEVIIRKQYRRLAFSLHPDKNRFPGAEAAFKLIAEAHSVLCDRQRRSEYDIKRKGLKNVVKPKQRPSNRNDVNKEPRSGATFLTVCQHCWKKHHFYSDWLNSTVRCTNCQMNFFAYSLKESYVPSSSNVPNGSRVPINMAPNQQCDTSSQQWHPVQPPSVGRGTHVKPNDRQVPANVHRNQQHDTSSQQGHAVQPSSVGRGKHVKANGRQVPANVVPNQQHDASSKQGYPVQPSASGGIYVKPNFNPVPANISPNQQSDTCSQQGHPVQPSSVGSGTHVKPNGHHVQANMFPNQQCSTRSQHGHFMCPSAEGCTHVKSNGSQNHASMFPDQQCDTHSQHGDPVELSSAGGGTDMKLRMNAAQHDELMKEYSRPGSDGKGNQSEMYREEVQFSTLNQEKFSDSTPDPAGSNIVGRRKSVRENSSAMLDVPNAPASANPSSAGGNIAEGNEYNKGNNNTGQEKKANYLYKNARGRSMPDPADISIAGNNFGMKEASAMSNASGSSYLCRSGRRKQDADGDIGLNSYNNKRLRTNDLPADVDMGRKEIFEDNVINDVRQSDPPYVSSKVDIQERGETTDKSNTEPADAINEKNKNAYYSELVSYPDPDFFNFEKLRDVHLFSIGQIWALYDHLDGMPRYYAQIKRFNLSKFKVDLAWLLYDAMGEEDEKWHHEELPVACGNFRLGKSRDRDTTEDKSTFSHIVSWTKGKGRNSFVIYPNKGEVWALYKGWSSQWSSDPNNHRSYEYDVVEVLSSMSVKDGATVKPLVRIKGFVSLFAPSKYSPSFIIPSSELLRFSHCIPSYRTKGNEKEGVPEGFLELDNVCLPANLDAAFPSITLDSYMSLGKSSSTSIDLTTGTTNNKVDLREEQVAQKEDQFEAHACHPMSADDYKDISSGHAPSQKNDDDPNELEESFLPNCVSSGVLTYPDSEFHIFEEDCSIDKIECGQIWALYCDFDSFPKYYGWIRKVEREPFIVHMIWLENCSELKQEDRWLKEDIPVSCGKFEVRNSKTKFDSIDTFSHLVNVKHTGTKWQFEVLPQVGEVWAIYLNWAPHWAPSRNDVCQFAVGEIVERTEGSIKLTLLRPVSGYRSVFRPDKQKGVMEIPTGERLRFSHKIPSFRLTKERGGKLCGFYELDPAAVPDVFLYRDT